MTKQKRKTVIIAIGAIIFTLILVGTIIGLSLRPIKNDQQITTTKETTTEKTTEETTKNTTTSSFYIEPSTTIPPKTDFLSSTSQSITKVPSSKIDNSSFSSVSAIAFYYDDGEEVYISDSEYNEICGVVMNETGYGSYEGCIAVAQAIRTQIIREKSKGNPHDISSVRNTYQEWYTKAPNELVRKAVTDVFYNHIVVTREPILFWCSGYSSWHSKQVYVCSFDGNSFYALPVKDW